MTMLEGNYDPCAQHNNVGATATVTADHFIIRLLRGRVPFRPMIPPVILTFVRLQVIG
jgi:hypothetical protein